LIDGSPVGTAFVNSSSDLVGRVTDVFGFGSQTVELFTSGVLV
jgi:hypothetical protein